MKIIRTLQGRPGNIPFLEIVISIGRHQNGAFPFMAGQDIGPAALPLSDHVGQVDSGETFQEEIPVGIGAHPAH